jgi:O-acetylhomoserine/O-acetylserine sulfhydrylase-like pyridoxal-dependent enzyme
MSGDKRRFETLALHGGTYRADPVSGAVAVPIYQTTSEAFRRATDAKTRAYYAEILPNPKLNVFPIKEVADIGRSFGVPLIADNTATPPHHAGTAWQLTACDRSSIMSSGCSMPIESRT